MKLLYDTTRSRHNPRSAYGRQEVDYFLCKHCHASVSAASFLSGVHNRNHCPYCLWSRHMDLHVAGDRLSACKAPMQPIGLTIKSTQKKYGGHGELMLVHLCQDCSQLSINRIAADDDPESMLDIFGLSSNLSVDLQKALLSSGISLLDSSQKDMVLSQLYGQGGPDTFQRTLMPLDQFEWAD